MIYHHMAFEIGLFSFSLEDQRLLAGLRVFCGKTDEVFPALLKLQVSIKISKFIVDKLRNLHLHPDQPSVFVVFSAGSILIVIGLKDIQDDIALGGSGIIVAKVYLDRLQVGMPCLEPLLHDHPVRKLGNLVDSVFVHLVRGISFIFHKMSTNITGHQDQNYRDQQF